MTKEEMLEQFPRTQNAEGNVFEEQYIFIAMDQYAKQEAIEFFRWMYARGIGDVGILFAEKQLLGGNLYNFHEKFIQSKETNNV